MTVAAAAAAAAVALVIVATGLSAAAAGVIGVTDGVGVMILARFTLDILVVGDGSCGGGWTRAS